MGLWWWQRGLFIWPQKVKKDRRAKKKLGRGEELVIPWEGRAILGELRWKKRNLVGKKGGFKNWVLNFFNFCLYWWIGGQISGKVPSRFHKDHKEGF